MTTTPTTPTTRLAFALCLAAVVTPLLHASTEPSGTTPTEPDAAPASYSSSVLPDAPGMIGQGPVYTATSEINPSQPKVKTTGKIKPFSKLGFAITIGTGGAGLEIATPLAQKFNLRVSGDYFSYQPTITVSGITVDGTIQFSSANASLDWYPFGNGFRVSPGVTLYNGNALSANALVPAGTTFTLNDTDYISGICNGYNAATGTCPANATYTQPVSGVFNMAFGNKVAPSITVGWGNLISRKENKHWSVPFEIGMQYIGDPLVTVNLTGQACQQTPGGGCGSINSGTDLTNLNAQIAEINSDLQNLRTYPIVKIGLGYKFF